MTATSAAALAPHERTRPKFWFSLAVLFCVLLVATVYWWNHGGSEQILFSLQPDFRISKLDAKAGTMTIERANEAFVVRCEDLCETFAVGEQSPMLYDGAVMVYRRNRKTYRFPILRHHVDFDVVGGRA